MRGVSRTSLAGAEDRLEALLDVTPDPASRIRLGEELFSISSLLHGSAALRRALTDPARDGAAKAALVERVLGARVARDTIDLVAGLARAHWSEPRDLADAADRLGISAVLAGAEAADRLETVEQEVYQLGREFTRRPELRRALLERRATAAAREELAERLMGPEVAPETSVLVRHVVHELRDASPEEAFERVNSAAAHRRERLVAHVVAAMPLTKRQLTKLTKLLTTRFGRPVRVAVDLEPEVLGGLRIQVGAEVIDGTTSRKLDAAVEELRG